MMPLGGAGFLPLFPVTNGRDPLGIGMTTEDGHQPATHDNAERQVILQVQQKSDRVEVLPRLIDPDLDECSPDAFGGVVRDGQAVSWLPRTNVHRASRNRHGSGAIG
jgi:hypothetical protein